MADRLSPRERLRGSAEPRFLIIGYIRKPHGVGGELKVTVESQEPARFFDLETVYVSRRPNDTNPRPLTVSGVRFNKEEALVKFAEIDGREEAAALGRHWLFITLEDALPLEEGEYYAFQAVGIDVITDDGQTLGKVSSILETGANDVFIVDGAQGEILIPDIDGVILEVDIPNGKMIVHLPDGLI
jgi:16S rRNA processing protein RimM